MQPLTKLERARFQTRYHVTCCSAVDEQTGDLHHAASTKGWEAQFAVHALLGYMFLFQQAATVVATWTLWTKIKNQINDGSLVFGLHWKSPSRLAKWAKSIRGTRREKNAIADEATKVIVVQQDEKLIHHSNALAFQMAISKNKQVWFYSSHGSNTFLLFHGLQ